MDSSTTALTRRRFLQAVAVTGTATLVPTWLADAAAAAVPVGAHDGVLVVVWLEGGNDGLNTVAPISDGSYTTARGRLAVTATTGLIIPEGVAFHPSLVGLKSRFDAGQVAVVQGVGDTAPDLSHSIASTRLMGGDGTAGANGGWLGRYLDGLPGGADPFHAVTIGSTTPLLVTGRSRRATVVGTEANDVLSPKAKDAVGARALACLREMGRGPTGLGQWGDALAAAGQTAIAVSARVQPTLNPKLPDNTSGPLELCARLVNADLGIRVLHVRQTGYDTHADQGWRQAAALTELDKGITQFFGSLQPRFAGRAAVAIMSEFGRRVQANASNGTDHGTASNWMVVGNRVKGGLYGASPSLTTLDRTGNLVPTVDHRSFYTSLLDPWLGADSRAILGGRFEDLGFMGQPA
ncbi:MAG: DUF1501 domain-containing protein [Acidobacteria bacterium]|nr:DUF1501 domain-containing protein [Acidobacteriota bacterium]